MRNAHCTAATHNKIEAFESIVVLEFKRKWQQGTFIMYLIFGCDRDTPPLSERGTPDKKYTPDKKDMPG